MKITATDREELKKKEKEIRKRKEEEEDARPLVWIKYTLGLKHQVKQVDDCMIRYIMFEMYFNPEFLKMISVSIKRKQTLSFHIDITKHKMSQSSNRYRIYF